MKDAKAPLPAPRPGALRSVLESKPPRLSDRKGRVEVIGEAAQALLDERMPTREAALFLGGALKAWLENGGSLERDYLRVVKPKSHHTARFLWAAKAHQDERQGDGGDVNLTPTPESEDETS